MYDRKQLLSQKLKIAKQKAKRSNLIKALPKNIIVVLESCNYITSPELDSIFEKVNGLWKFELHRHDFIEKYSDNRKEFSWEREVIRFVNSLHLEITDSYLLLGIEESPAFVVNGKWAINSFHTLWEHTDFEDVWILSTDYTKGIIVSRYGGYLEYDPNPREIFYAITVWS